ncbi:HepT-like ribonuclease domain-containing protein [Collinsella sp. An2]|uniref:HepT-like ribonuclease domain-containing protein n=1 Tax=Collinsella sp. An2 TaxID=1965585 RepID=UPI000B36B00B|nr:HepT-like ribonuclease domain-containing protein [Collinsella sp. An2]OUP08406.1 hypothetical protein B5F33_06795 [Collinsella sp. An2]
MSARNSDDGRVLELWRILNETKARVSALGLTKERFVSDESLQGRINVDAIFMCVFHVTEEAGNMSDETQRAYPDIPWRAIHGMRNIFAHDYGKLDRAVIWSAVTDDFPTLKSFCLKYAERRNIKLDGYKPE